MSSERTTQSDGSNKADRISQGSHAERSHSFLFIHDVQRRAAGHLGLRKGWYYQSRETEECPGCGERVKPGVAVCKTCHAVLDRDKALALGLLQPTAQLVAGTPVEAASVKQGTRK